MLRTPAPGPPPPPRQAPEDDGGSPVSAYLVELRPRSKAAQRTTVDDWVVAYQVGWAAGWVGGGWACGQAPSFWQVP